MLSAYRGHVTGFRGMVGQLLVLSVELSGRGTRALGAMHSIVGEDRGQCNRSLTKRPPRAAVNHNTRQLTRLRHCLLYTASTTSLLVPLENLTISLDLASGHGVRKPGGGAPIVTSARRHGGERLRPELQQPIGSGATGIRLQPTVRTLNLQLISPPIDLSHKRRLHSLCTLRIGLQQMVLIERSFLLLASALSKCS